MPLYQTSVLKKYIKQQEQSALAKAYKKYITYFLNPVIQENIRSSKEEQFQATFLSELFVNILGYTLNPNPDFNLTTEFKNQKNNRKADGAILKDGKAIGVIELKGTRTKDLESIRKQAFDYKANHKGCAYVITSNFEKLRFYINDATEFLEFNLFELTPEDFGLLYLCLHKDNIYTNLPLHIKEASLVEEEKITKQFYKHYSVFKRELWRDLVKQNGSRLKNEARDILNTAVSSSGHPEPVEGAVENDIQELQRIEKNVKRSLFKKSQKLIDRFLFIFFAEDRGLLPPNSTVQILDKWKADVDFGDERPLYDLFKQYFRFLDRGRQGTASREEIYAYNGGLFKADAILDGLEIDNDLLYIHTLQLSGYDFESQVDVNILGHIFENSLNEIESINAEIDGQTFDKQKSKRKKDGVFYTPKYITKYIVENTVGKLCEEKKTALGLQEDAYFKGRKNRNKTTITTLVQVLDDYRAWLLQLTICDPACGSGAFLNQALDFLIKEHQYIDELKTKILGGGIVFSDIENTILENNIYGVDLNEESVEIAKLSLWLRTAQPRRKLNDLSSNIKCGNSLIDDPKVAGDKAFDWQEQFPHVFAQGGFDVVIGNPPYVTNKLGKRNKSTIEEEMKFYKKRYGDLVEYKGNLFSLFIGITNSILSEKSIFSFIIPNSIMFNSTFKNIRNFIRSNFNILEFVNLSYEPFEDANTGGCLIFNLRKQHKKESAEVIEVSSETDFVNNNYKIQNIDYNENIEITDGKFLTNIDGISIIKNCMRGSTDLGELVKFYQGIITGDNKKYISNEKVDDRYKKVLRGADILRYGYSFSDNYVLFDKDLLWSNTNEEIFKTRPKLINRQTSSDLIVAFDDQKNYTLDSTHCQIVLTERCNIKTLLCIENSKLLNFIYNFLVNEGKRTFAQVKTVNLKKLPIRIPDLNTQIIFEQEADIVIALSSDLGKVLNKFKKYFSSVFNLGKLSRKLDSWHLLDFNDFIKELNKAIKAANKQREKDALEKEAPVPSSAVETLTKKDEFEWLDLFEENKKKAQDIQAQINTTEQEIDQMVYKLYGLTEEEIRIVESA